MKYATNFGAWLKRQRKLKGFTQDTLANEVGCAVVTIRKIEQNQRRPSMDLAQQLARALAIPDHQKELFLQVALGHQPLQRLEHQNLSNLPAFVTTMIGREHALRHSIRQLTEHSIRILTITGPAGIGKTTLALHLGAALQAHIPDGVWFIDLTVVSHAEGVSSAIAQALGLPVGNPRSTLTTIIAHLSNQAALLILDNFEHVLPARTIIADILRECVWVTIIITSREPLHLRNEHQLPLNPLEIPPRTSHLDMASVVDYSAIALFLERITTIEPTFTLTPANTPIIVELCRMLDGLPLAIELVAAQCAYLTPHRVVSYLKEHHTSFAFLSDTPSSRHSTIENALDWGYALLTNEEQDVFDQIAVFAGGWTLDAAEAICTPTAGPISATIGALVTKNFIVRSEAETGDIRFSLLTPIRIYATEHLTRRVDYSDLAERHAAYYGNLAHTLTASLRNGYAPQTMAVLTQERANLECALQWALSRGALPIAQTISTSLVFFQQYLVDVLADTQATNTVLERMVTERTSALQAAISALECREHDLKAALDQAELSNRRLSRFLATISHEVHTALNSIFGFAALIRRGENLTERQSKLLGRIESNSNDLLDVFANIVDLTTMEDGDPALTLGPVELHDLLQEIHIHVQGMLTQRGLTLSVVQGPPTTVIADHARLLHSLKSIVLASIETIDYGGIIVQVRQEAMTILTLRDTGIGLDQGLLEQLRVPFSEHDHDPIILNSGTRLALAVSLKLIEAHGGKIDLSRQISGGTIWTISLPAYQTPG